MPTGMFLSYIDLLLAYGLLFTARPAYFPTRVKGFFFFFWRNALTEVSTPWQNVALRILKSILHEGTANELLSYRSLYCILRTLSSYICDYMQPYREYISEFCTALKCIASSRNSCATLHPGELKHSIEQRSATPAYLSLYYTYGMLRSTHALDLALDLACPGPCPPSCLAVRLQILQRSTQCFIMSRHF